MEIAPFSRVHVRRLMMSPRTLLTVGHNP